MFLIWLSHILDDSTPLYGGSKGFRITLDKSMAAGDSCTTSILALPSHAGTHVDAPLHFLENAKSVEKYAPKAWFFHSPHVIFFSAQPGQLITPEDLNLAVGLDKDTDLILLCSGFELHRNTDIYWKEGPGLAPKLAEYFINHCPNLRAVGMDFLSISSLKYREEGRAAHRAFLEREILLFEDMALKALTLGDRLGKVIALPLRFTLGDGAPCTIIGFKF